MTSGFSDSVDIRSPNVLVKLQLQADAEAAFGNPPGQLLKINLAPGRRDQDRERAIFQIVVCDYLAGKIPILSIHNNEFDLVLSRSQQGKIGPVISFSFA